MAATKKKVGPFKMFIIKKRTASSIVRHGPGGPKTKKR